MIPTNPHRNSTPFLRRNFLRLAGASFVASGSGRYYAAEKTAVASEIDEDLRKEIKGCDDERLRIVAEASVPLDDLGKKYKVALVGLKLPLQEQGRLESLIALEAEITSIVPGMGPQSRAADPEIAKLQDKYSFALVSRALKYRDAILKAELFYGSELGALSKKWTKSGRIGAAVEVSKIAAESGKRAVRIQEMIKKQKDYLSLCNPDLCRIVSSQVNDGKKTVAFGKSLKSQDEMEFEDAIWAPAAWDFDNRSIQCIISVDVPPGFNVVSFVGVASFAPDFWNKRLYYSIAVGDKIIASFESVNIHWPRIIVLPADTREFRFITSAGGPGSGGESYWAWPRLHTGLSPIAASTGWTKKLSLKSD